MSENARYRLLQGGYWMLFCAGYGYVTVYLLDWGYAAAQIGAVTAVFGLLAALGQPVLGKIADRGGRWGWKPLLLLLAGLCLAAAAALLLCPAALKWLFYGLFLLLISSMMPLINAASFYYAGRGVAVDFGTARGIGSLSYAALSLILGQAAARLGTCCIPAAGVLVGALVLCTALRMPYSAAPAAPQAETAKAAAKGGFVRRYPAFCVMLAAGVLMLSFHNITSTYLVQMLEAVGGDSSSLGVAMALAAVLELPVMFGFSRIIRRWRADTLLAVAGCAYALKAAVYLAAGSVAAIIAAQLLQTFSFALYAAASVYYAEATMAPCDKVTGQACISCTITVGAVLGNLLGGWVLDLAGLRPMLYMAFGMAAAGAALAILAAAGRRRAR